MEHCHIMLGWHESTCGVGAAVQMSGVECKLSMRTNLILRYSEIYGLFFKNSTCQPHC